jgi:hemerythrin-like domain-containing protein
MLHVIPALLKAQHAEILKVLDEFTDLLKQEESEEHTRTLKAMLLQLNQRLTLHLAQEDYILYPTLTNSTDAGHREIAHQYVREMGAIADAFETFINRWQLGNNIRDDGPRFRSEAAIFIEELRVRIDREEQFLFPLVNI